MHCIQSRPAAALRGLAAILLACACRAPLRAGQAPAFTEPPTVIQAQAGNNYLPYTPPAKRPALRMLLDDKTYADRKAAALKIIDKEALAQAKACPTGYLALTADPGRPANKAGIKPGDILCRIDDQPIQNSVDWMEAKGEINLAWFDADHKLQTAKVKGGPLGVQVKCIWPGAAEFYWQSGPKNAKWDDDCLVAAAAFPTDPELAETALAKALKAGLKDCYFTDLLAAEIAWSELRFDCALHFAYYAWKSDKPPTMDTLNQLLPDLSAATSFLSIGDELYKTAGEKIPQAHREHWLWCKDRWNDNVAGTAINLPLAQAVAGKPRWNWLTHGTHTSETPVASFIQMRRKASLTLDSTGGKWQYAVLNSTARNADLAFTLNIPALDSPETEKSQRGHCLGGMVNTAAHDMKSFWNMPMLSSEANFSFTLWPGYIWFGIGNQKDNRAVYLPTVIYRNYFHGKMRWRVVAYNRWTEIYLNDAVVFRAPNRADCNNMSAFFRMKDGKLEFSDLRFEEILDQAKPDTPMEPDPPMPKDEF